MSGPTFRTVPEMFLDRVAKTPDAPAFLYPKGSEWVTLSWKQTADRVRAIASGLKSLGLTSEQRCAIFSGTQIAWILGDLGILCAGGATTTIYPSNSAEDCAFILQDSETIFALVENDEQVAKITSKRSEIPQVKKLIVVDGRGSDDGWVITLEKLEELGRAFDAKDPAAFARDANAVRGDALATLIYTSGTTGKPKGVELTHDCWVYEGQGIDDLGILHPDDLQYLWLPLAHSFGKVLLSAQFRIGFPSAVDGRVDRIKDNLVGIKPTFVCGVPRIFEKLQHGIIAKAHATPGLKAKIFDWGIDVGRRVSLARQGGGSPGLLLSLQNMIAGKLVHAKIHAALGGRLRFFISGSAPMSKEVGTFFDGAGVLILEGYGLTESSAGTFVNRPGKNKIGTVGLPLPGSEVRIAPEDGEILLKGRGIMRGYHNMPEATAETLTPDRWLKTGDIGEVDAEGFLKITDRKKDLIKTSGGKYVAPQSIEGKIKAICPYVSQVLVHGNNRNFCSALITIDADAIRKWAAENGLSGRSYTELAADEKTHALIKSYVTDVNSKLGNWETIKKFALLPIDLTEANGELTASMKVKRKVVETKYKALLDGFYTGGRD